MWKLLPEIEEITEGQAHENTRKLYRDILTRTDVFINQKRECLWTHNKDGVTREFMEGATRGLQERWMEGNYLRSLLIDKDGHACQNISIQFSCACPSVISSISGKSFHFPFPYFANQMINYKLFLTQPKHQKKSPSSISTCAILFSLLKFFSIN